MNTFLKNKMLFLGVALLALLLVVSGCQSKVEQVDKGADVATSSITGAVVADTTPGADQEDVSSDSESDEPMFEDAEYEIVKTTPKVVGSAKSNSTFKEDGVTEIKVTNAGFVPSEVTINAGETVRWVNERSGRLSKALILGNRECVAVHSSIFAPGESYEFTFNSPMKCIIAEGITTRELGTINVE